MKRIILLLAAILMVSANTYARDKNKAEEANQRGKADDVEGKERRSDHDEMEEEMSETPSKKDD